MLKFPSNMLSTFGAQIVIKYLKSFKTKKERIQASLDQIAKLDKEILELKNR
jgi:hypothetical protein